MFQRSHAFLGCLGPAWSCHVAPFTKRGSLRASQDREKTQVRGAQSTVKKPLHS